MGDHLFSRRGTEKRFIAPIIVMPQAVFNNRCCWRSRYVGSIGTGPFWLGSNFRHQPEFLAQRSPECELKRAN